MGIEGDISDLDSSLSDLSDTVGEHDDSISRLENLVGMLLQGRRVAYKPRGSREPIEATVLFGGFNSNGVKAQDDEGNVHEIKYYDLMTVGGAP